MKKSIESNELVEEIKDILEDVVNPADTVVEIEDDTEITKALRPEVTKEQMYSVIEHLMEAVESMLEIPEEEEEESPETESPENPTPVGNEVEDANNMANSWPIAKSEDSEDSEDEKKEIYKSDDPEDAWDNEMQKCWSGYTQRGMKEKGGRMVPNCVPVEKAQDLTEADQVTKSLWGGSFKPKK